MPEEVEPLAVSDDEYTLPVTDVLTGRGFVTGKSGSGKSNTASVVAEELLERGLGLLIVDTDGEYLGLGERYELLHAGTDERCDLDLETTEPRRIAELALGENVPIVLDISGYLEESASDAIVHDVIRELFVAEKEHTKPFLVFVEEAHEFVPQQGGGDDLSQLLIRVAKRGRKRGLGICAMSQRPAAVDKDYITQCNWLVWHRLTWENDTAVAGRILGDDADETVQSLADGEALVLTDWDESIERVQFRRKHTVDDGSTPTLEEAYGPPSARKTHVVGSDVGDEFETATEPGVSDRSENDSTTVDSSGTTISFSDDSVGKSPDDRTGDLDANAESTPNGGRPNHHRRKSSARRSRRRELVESESEGADWEAALLFAYIYETIVEFHVRTRDRIEVSISSALGRLRQRDADTSRHAEYRPTGLENRAIRLLSLLVIVGVYVGTIAVAGALVFN